MDDIKTKSEKVQMICCAIAVFLLILVISVNVTLIVQMYIAKEEIPDVFGVFPLIPLDDGGAPFVADGDFVLCRKIGGEGLFRLKDGDIVTHFSDSGHTKLFICQVVSVNGNTATLLSQSSNKPYELSVDEIIGSIRFSIPVLGFIVYFLSTLPGFLLCVVIPVFGLTELYLYSRKRAARHAIDEESMLLAELAWQKAERERLLALLNRPRKRRFLHVLGASITALCLTVPLAPLIGQRWREKKDAEEARRQIEQRREKMAEGIGRLIHIAGKVFKPRRRKRDRR